MLRLLFWNLRGNPRLIKLLARETVSREINVIVIAECPAIDGDIAHALSTAEREFAPHSGLVNKRIRIFCTSQVELAGPVAESQYLTIHRLKLPDAPDILLACMHGISRLEDELLDLDEEACNAADLLREAETKAGHRRTILVGDFNLNPFDHGMAKAKGFFGVMSRKDASRETQRLKHQKYPLFYNPMWSRLGDHSPGPPGTYYRAKSSHLSYYWHSYDQVLIRPVLIPCFEPENLMVLTSAGGVELLREGMPDSKNLSDHLPIYIALELEKVNHGKIFQ